MILNKLVKKFKLHNDWNIFAKYFNLCYVEKENPCICGQFNNFYLEINLKKLKKNSLSQFLTKFRVKHLNKNQQRIRVLNKNNFSKLSLLHRIHENLGYRFYNHNFTDKHMLFSVSEVKNELSEDIFEKFRHFIDHELKIRESDLIYYEPKIILNHNDLIDISYFLTLLSEEISENKFNITQEVILK